MSEPKFLKIKTFHFPSFEDWYKDGEFGEVSYTEEIGEITCKIAITGWGCNGNPLNDFEVAVSTCLNPTNIYSDKIICHRRKIRYDNTEEIREWYDEVTKKVNQEWMQYIYDKFLEE